MIELSLPYPPSLNRYYRTFQGRILIAADGRKYRDEVATLVMIQRAGKGSTPLAGRIAVSIAFAAPDKRRRDADNLLKAVLDAITHTGRVWLDDSQIDDLRIIRAPVQHNRGEIAMRIEEISAEAEAA